MKRCTDYLVSQCILGNSDDDDKTHIASYYWEKIVFAGLDITLDVLLPELKNIDD